MKWLVLLLAAAALSGAEKAPKRFTGVIHSNQCVGPNCATQCPITKEPRYTLQAGDEAWVLSDQKAAAKFSGRKVVVTGSVGTDNKFKVLSIVPAR
jgi:hypothetical protein